MNIEEFSKPLVAEGVRLLVRRSDVQQNIMGLEVRVSQASLCGIEVLESVEDLWKKEAANITPPLSTRFVFQDGSADYQKSFLIDMAVFDLPYAHDMLTRTQSLVSDFQRAAKDYNQDEMVNVLTEALGVFVTAKKEEAHPAGQVFILNPDAKLSGRKSGDIAHSIYVRVAQDEGMPVSIRSMNDWTTKKPEILLSFPILRHHAVMEAAQKLKDKKVDCAGLFPQTPMSMKSCYEFLLRTGFAG